MNTPPCIPCESGKSGLAITSLVCGIISVTCLGIITGIPAIICGHIARSRIKKNPTTFSGAGMALAGLILGYISIVLTIVIPFIVLPAITVGTPNPREIQLLSNAKQIHLATLIANRDRDLEGDKSLGFPADIGCRSAQQFIELLVKGDYIGRVDLPYLHLEEFEIGNVSAEDPGDTILVQSKPNDSRVRKVVVTKDGTSQIVRKNAPSPGKVPPRNPPFLE